MVGITGWEVMVGITGRDERPRDPGTRGTEGIAGAAPGTAKVGVRVPGVTLWTPPGIEETGVTEYI